MSTIKGKDSLKKNHLVSIIDIERDLLEDRV